MSSANKNIIKEHYKISKTVPDALDVEILARVNDPKNPMSNRRVTKWITIPYEKALNRNYFLNLATNENSEYYVGDFAKFSWDHKIDTEDGFPEKASAAKWLGGESHYYRKNFFYISGLNKYASPGVLKYLKKADGTEPDTVSCFLRVSNHPVDHQKWEEEQARYRAEFCLNFILDPEGKGFQEWVTTNTSKEHGCTEIDLHIDNYYRGGLGTTEDGTPRNNIVDQVISMAKAGKVIPMDLIVQCVENPARDIDYKHTGPGHTEDQFNPHRRNPDVPQNRPCKVFYNFRNGDLPDPANKPKVTVQPKKEFPDEIPYEVAKDVVDSANTFSFEDHKYALHLNDDKKSDIYGYACPFVPVFASRRGAGANVQTGEKEKEDTKIPIYLPFDIYVYNVIEEEGYENGTTFKYRGEDWEIVNDGKDVIARSVNGESVPLLEHRIPKLTLMDIKEMVIQTMRLLIG